MVIIMIMSIHPYVHVQARKSGCVCGWIGVATPPLVSTRIDAPVHVLPIEFSTEETFLHSKEEIFYIRNYEVNASSIHSFECKNACWMCCRGCILFCRCIMFLLLASFLGTFKYSTTVYCVIRLKGLIKMNNYYVC